MSAAPAMRVTCQPTAVTQIKGLRDAGLAGAAES